MITYTKKEQDGKVIIVKSGHEHEFTMEEIRSHLAKLDKLEKELTAQVSLEESKMKNVEESHEIVKTLTDVQLVACSIYDKAKEIKAKCESKLAEIAEARKEYAEDIEEIKKQTGVELYDGTTAPTEPASEV